MMISLYANPDQTNRGDRARQRQTNRPPFCYDHSSCPAGLPHPR